jgi:uncharacterized membrane-anchored protein
VWVVDVALVEGVGMNRIRQRSGLVAAWLLVVVVALVAVQGHERTLDEGQLVLLRLAPVDPRSLMQGDYMALRFAANSDLAQRIGDISPSGQAPSYAHFAVDDEGRAALDAVGSEPKIAPGRISMRIRATDGEPSVGPNAFFFQEGTGELYETAQWGGFRVAQDGTALLVSLHDAALQAVGTQRR